MAYNRAPRQGVLDNPQTGPNVSPNTYYVSSEDGCCDRGTHWAPFLSGACRNSVKKSEGPSPNSYFPKIRRKIVGGASMLYTAPRFRESKYATPASTHYDPFHVEEEFQNDDEDAPRLKGYLYHCCVPYTLLGYAPSIPCPRHSGYEIADNRLVRHSDSSTKSALGPASYSVNRSTFCSCYKGCFWGKRTAKAREFKVPDTPGVGSYFLDPPPSPLNDYLNRLRNERKKNACNLRYIENLQRIAMKNDYPAANEYLVGVIKCPRIKKKLVPKRLNCWRAIFKMPKEETPAPNAYNDPRTALNYLVKPSCVKELNAFLVNAPRFPKIASQIRPAPNQYNLPTFLENACKRVSPYAVRNTAFNTSVPKKLCCFPSDNTAKPASEQCECSEVRNDVQALPAPTFSPTSPFASKTKRFKSYASDYSASPASYSITPAVTFVRSKKSFRNVKKNNFLSTEKRFERLRNFLVVEDNSYIKGFAYDCKIVPWKANNVGRFGLAKRFPEPKETGPGPFNYSIHSNLTSCAANKSFNVNLINPESRSVFQKIRMKLKGLDKSPNYTLSGKRKVEKPCNKRLKPVNIAYDDEPKEDAVNFNVFPVKKTKTKEKKDKRSSAEVENTSLLKLE